MTNQNARDQKESGNTHDEDEDIVLTGGHAKKIDGKSYVWESGYNTQAWELLESHASEEETSKNLKIMEQRSVRERVTKNKLSSVVRRGIIRYTYLILDLSENVQKIVANISQALVMKGTSDTSNNISLGTVGSHVTSTKATQNRKYHATRHAMILDNAIDFVKEFFDQNPLSQLGIIVTRNGIADKLSDLTGKSDKLIHILKDDKYNYSAGLPSIQNALNLAMSSLIHVPGYGAKEIIMVYASKSTCDPGDIMQTIQSLKQYDIRCSVVQLDCEMYICKYLCKETKGQYAVPYQSEKSFHEQLFQHTSPPPVTISSDSNTANIMKQKTAEMIQMGFPQKKSESLLSLCVCHQQIRPGGFICPRCSSKHCSLPTDCAICGLKLVSSPQLARSYHHMFPVKPFIEVPYVGFVKPGDDKQQNLDNSSFEKIVYCFGCQKALEEDSALRVKCTACGNIFCVECDAFIHELLHNCPGCE